MPTKKAIASHWSMGDDYCWGCGINTNLLDRAHIKARSQGGSDTEENLALLCRFCHSNIQESLCHNEKGRQKFIKVVKDGMPFFQLNFSFLQSKFKSGFYDDILKDILISKGYIEEDEAELKQLINELKEITLF